MILHVPASWKFDKPGQASTFPVGTKEEGALVRYEEGVVMSCGAAMGKGEGQKNKGFERLLELLPQETKDFEGTLYGQPAALAYFGTGADAECLREKAEQIRMSDPARMCEHAMALAEVIEGNAPDRRAYFITDAETRSYVFTGAKWRAGWVFIMGAGDHATLCEAFR